MRALRALVLTVALAGVPASFIIATPAHAQETEAPSTDPFPETVRAFMDHQDKLFDAEKFDQLVEESEKLSRAGTPDGWYILGRAHGMIATRHLEEGEPQLYRRSLDEARDAFGTAQEKGGLLYAPALVGLARCAWVDGDLETASHHLKQALRIAPQFRMAVLEAARIEWNRKREGEAENVLHTFLSEHPGDVEVRLMLGVFKFQRKRWTEAQGEFEVVLQHEQENVQARKLLGTTLMFRQRLEEAIPHLEWVRLATPDDPESYALLYQIHKQLKDEPAALIVLGQLLEALPGSEYAKRAEVTIEEISADSDFFSRSGESVRDRLDRELESTDPAVVLRALGEMLEIEWAALPKQVYLLLDPERGQPEIRLAAMRLIRRNAKVEALPLLEEIVFHPLFRDEYLPVRREAARALSELPTPATLMILWRCLNDDDPELREAGVQGIASRTGKYFRSQLAAVTSEEDWPAEKEAYGRWWGSLSSSIAKRDAAKALGAYFGSRTSNRRRIGRYLLEAMRDGNERTWRVSYDVFRKMSFRSFGGETGAVGPEERERITGEAQTWFDENVPETAAPKDEE
jgi:tetratricopeptide (TPR) repeat protein